eukprot:scaffold119680_cov39-Prasinocladus_malaysianus.AAC.1
MGSRADGVYSIANVTDIHEEMHLGGACKDACSCKRFNAFMLAFLLLLFQWAHLSECFFSLANTFIPFYPNCKARKKGALGSGLSGGHQTVGRELIAGTTDSSLIMYDVGEEK